MIVIFIAEVGVKGTIKIVKSVFKVSKDKKKVLLFGFLVKLLPS